jgi:hypothetical protein
MILINEDARVMACGALREAQDLDMAFNSANAAAVNEM